MPGFTPFEFDENILSTPTDNTRIHVREGDYLLELTGGKASPEDKDPYIMFTGKIVAGPEGAGKSLAYFAQMKEATGAKKSSFFNLGNLIASALSPEAAEKLQRAMAPDPNADPPRKGLAITSYKQFVAFADKMAQTVLGKQIYALVADDSYNGKVTSKIEQVGPPSKYSATPPPVSAPAGNASPPPPPANNQPVDANFMDSVDALFTDVPAV